MNTEAEDSRQSEGHTCISFKEEAERHFLRQNLWEITGQRQDPYLYMKDKQSPYDEGDLLKEFQFLFKKKNGQWAYLQTQSTNTKQREA